MAPKFDTFHVLSPRLDLQSLELALGVVIHFLFCALYLTIWYVCVTGRDVCVTGRDGA